MGSIYKARMRALDALQRLFTNMADKTVSIIVKVDWQESSADTHSKKQKCWKQKDKRQLVQQDKDFSIDKTFIDR